MKTAPVTRRPVLRASVACLDELVDDLPGLQVAPAGHPRRGTELAAHGAADLGREAEADGPRLVQRDDHGLDGQAVVRPEAEFLEPVGAGDNGVLELEPRQVADRLDQPPGDLAVASPRGGVVDSPGHDRRQQPADDFRADAQGQRPLHEDRREPGLEGRSRPSLSKKTGKTVDVSHSFIRVANASTGEHDAIPAGHSTPVAIENSGHGLQQIAAPVCPRRLQGRTKARSGKHAGTGSLNRKNPPNLLDSCFVQGSTSRNFPDRVLACLPEVPFSSEVDVSSPGR